MKLFLAISIAILAALLVTSCGIYAQHIAPHAL